MLLAARIAPVITRWVYNTDFPVAPTRTPWLTFSNLTYADYRKMDSPTHGGIKTDHKYFEL